MCESDGRAVPGVLGRLKRATEAEDVVYQESARMNTGTDDHIQALTDAELDESILLRTRDFDLRRLNTLNRFRLPCRRPSCPGSCSSS